MDATTGPDADAQLKLAGLLAADDLDAMLAACGGDGATLADIAAALRFIGEQRHPDLGAALRLAFARDELLRWNRKIPAELPVAWARLGEPDRAEAMARTLSQPPGVRGDVLLSLADLAFAAGDTERGVRLADEVEAAACYSSTLCELATVLARAGELERARRLVDEAETLDAVHGGGYPTAVIEAHIAVGQMDRAEAIMRTHGRSTRAVAALAGIEDDPQRRQALIDEALDRLDGNPNKPTVIEVFGVLAKIMIDTGEGHRLVALAKNLSASDYADVQVYMLGALGNAVAAAGDLDGARLLLAEAKAVNPADVRHDQETYGADPEPSESWYELKIRVGKSQSLGCKPQSRCANVVVRLGDLERAEKVVRRAYTDEWRAAALATLASRAAGVGDFDRARRLATESEAHSRTTASPKDALPELIALAEALAAAGDLEQAEATARSIHEPADRLKALATLSSRSARAGDLDRARRLVQEPLDKISSITGPNWQADQWNVWDKSVRACTDLGDPALAEAAGQHFSSSKDRVLTQLAEAWIRVGNLARAEATARRIPVPHQRHKPLTLVAWAWIKAGDLARAEAIALNDLPDTRADLLVALAEARVATGDLDRAEGIARSTERQSERARVLIACAQKTTRDGDAARLIDAALAAARAATPEVDRFHTLTALIRPLGRLGEREQIARVTTEAVQVAWALPDPHNRYSQNAGTTEGLLVLLATTLARAGELERAQNIAVALVAPPIASDSPPQAPRPLTTYSPQVLRTLTTVADGWAAAGDFDRAEAILAAGPEFHRPAALAVLATTAWRAGDRERVNRLLAEAEVVARALPDPQKRHRGLVHIATGFVRAGDPDRAEAVVRSLADRQGRISAWEALAEALVAAGELARAAALTPAITDPKRRAELIEALAAAGDDPDRVRRLVAAALVDTPALTLLPVLAKVDPAAVIAASPGHGGNQRPGR
jgi:tetratricopeptide (TPR) repeat protein